MLTIVNVELTFHADATWPLSKAIWPPGNRDRGYVSYIFTMHRLLQLLSIASQVGLREEEHSMPKYLGYTLEDWNRAFELLHQWVRQHGSQKSKVESAKSKKQANGAVTPVYITDLEIEKGLKQQQEEAQKASDTLVVIPEAGFEEWPELSLPTGGPRLTDEAKDQNLEAVSNTISTASAYPKVSADRAKQMRPFLSEENFRLCCEHQGKCVKQLWPPPGTPLFATLESGSPDHPVDVDAARLQASADIEGEALDSEAMTEEEMQNFWNTQTHLNYVSAKAKSYAECCKILDLDPDFPAIAIGAPVRRSAAEIAVFQERRAQQMSPKAKKANPHCTDGDVRLYPWQVQAIEWMIEMEDSKLRAAILADDMGLGKTITALVFLILQTRARYPPAVKSFPSLLSHTPRR